MTHLYVLIWLAPSDRDIEEHTVTALCASHDKGVLEWERSQHMKKVKGILEDYKIEEVEVH